MDATLEHSNSRFESIRFVNENESAWERNVHNPIGMLYTQHKLAVAE